MMRFICSTIPPIRRCFTMTTGLALLLFATQSLALSYYLPSDAQPQLIANAEKLLIAANIPIVKRPLALADIEHAITITADSHPALSHKVAQQLAHLQQDAGLDHATLTIATHDGVERPLDNGKSALNTANYQVKLAGHYRLNAYANLSVGAQFNDATTLNIYGEETPLTPENTYLSLGWDSFQTDIGYREHWWGPFQTGAMLISSQAASMPSITFSNSQALTAAKLKYELFYAEMSESNAILSANRDERLTGTPKLFGMHFSANPFSGFTLSVNRMLQYGGADRSESPKDIFQALFNVKENENIDEDGKDFGNQLTSVATRFIFSGKHPIALYMEYAGEDTSATSDVHLGNTAMLAGIHLPFLPHHFDITYEYATLQNGWFVNNNYGNSYTNNGALMGHWLGNERARLSDAVGSKSHVLKILQQLSGDKSWALTLKHSQNENYSSVNTAQEYQAAISADFEWQIPIKHHLMGINLQAGEDYFGDGYSRLSASWFW